jgi:hypothetical protein
VSDTAAALVMVAAHRAGQKAARDGQPMTALPYDQDAEDPRERARARMWLRGYDRVNPTPIDYSD